MSVLYVREQGAYIRKKNECLAVSKGGETLLQIPAANVNDVAVIGNVQVTSQALQMLMTRGIDVSYFTFSGKYLGHTAAETSKNVFFAAGTVRGIS